MKAVIITGLSGAGKTQAIDCLEDMGYYCVDNLPISLLLKFAELVNGEGSEISRVALGIDIRNGRGLKEIGSLLEKMDEAGYQHEILFMDSSDATLIKRYKETRRVHPMTGDRRIEDGIREERRQLEYLKRNANYIIDTSKLLVRELIPELNRIFVQNGTFKNMVINVLSFGFKHGIPSDADLVFDVRFLPNPYYVEQLRPKTGNDKEVQDYVMASDQSVKFMDKLSDMISFLIPNYVKEGKNQLVIAIGCTGGKHRSVTLANKLYEVLSREEEYRVTIEHRDILK